MRFLVAIIVFFAAFHSLFAAEWQWSVPDGAARAYLWIPPDCRKLKGVVVSSHNMIEEGILEHPVMRKTLTDLGFAAIWVVPYLDVTFDFNKGAGEHFQWVVDSLASASGYAELSSVPVVPLGHSACASFPWNFAAWDPERTLAIISIHGDAPQTSLTGYGGPKVGWGERTIDGIPALMAMNEYEWTEARRTPAHEFVAKHPASPIAFYAESGRGHFDFSDRLVNFLASFLRKAAAARLPAEGAGPLRAIDPKKGWLVEEWHFDESLPKAPPAPYAKFTGDRSQAFWAFDEDMAVETEAAGAAGRGKKSQLLAVWTDGAANVPRTGEPVNLAFQPDPDGVTFHLQVGFAEAVPGGNDKSNAARWARLPVGAPLSHAEGGGPILLSRIVGPVAQTGPNAFVYRPSRAEYTSNRRNQDIWLLAEHPGDAVHKSIVQQVKLQATPNTKGKPQSIAFPEIADQKADVQSLQLGATSDAGLPISYYVLEGPAEIEGDILKFTPIPVRAKYPVKVTVVATQFGNSDVATAPVAERTFYLRSGDL